MTIEVVEQPASWRKLLDSVRSEGMRVGVVPTMGALHAGHMSLIRRAAGECDFVAVTDYVNPLQFGPTEDLDSYPRDIRRDVELSAEAGASVVFAPLSSDLWARPPATSVRVGALGALLEGRARPGHFDGVATIVAKLLSLAGACNAYFGEKDYQQLLVVRALVTDLSLPAEVIACPVVREPDGLALSSRNTYLSPEERSLAPHLYYALLAGKRAVEEDGVTDPSEVESAMASHLADRGPFGLEYAAVADPELLVAPARVDSEVRLLIAARLGRARLIDNVAATPPEAREE